MQVSAELPLLYPLGRAEELPEIVYPSDEDVLVDTRSRAGKLEDRPFLDSLPVYRYRPEYREAGRR